MKSKKIIRLITAVIIAAFGLLTLFLTTSIIFDLFGIREKEGNYVPFIIWANFVSGILYVLSVYGLIKQKKWTFSLLALASVILFVAFIFLKIHISNGGIFETKTVSGMIFRKGLTIVFAFVAYFTIPKNSNRTIA